MVFRSLRLVALTMLLGCMPEGPAGEGSVSGPRPYAGKADGAGCFARALLEERSGVLSFVNARSTSLDELDLAAPDGAGLRADAAKAIVAARPIEDWSALDAVSRVGEQACNQLIAYVCGVKGLCEPSVEFVSWNLKDFPLSRDAVGEAAAALDDLGADIAGLQEIDSESSFKSLVRRLPNFKGVLGATGFGTRVAVVYRDDRFELLHSENLFEDDDFAFPRPPLMVTFAMRSRPERVFTIIVVHLKASWTHRDRARRLAGIEMLEGWVRSHGGLPVMMMGDFNDELLDDPDEDVFAPLRDRYLFLTTQAERDRQYTYIPSRQNFDHIITTRNFSSYMPRLDVEVVALDKSIEDYDIRVSDHRPVLSSHRIR